MKKSVVEINWRPDRSDSRPAYIQITDYMLHKIQTGEWIAGAFLPNQRELSKR
jgi:GntR family transcriptional regulator of abcA and norABC